MDHPIVGNPRPLREPVNRETAWDDEAGACDRKPAGTLSGPAGQLARCIVAYALFRHGVLAASGLAGVLASGPHAAVAHPHVRIDTAATLRFDDNQRLVGLEARWAFDYVYTYYAVEGFDADGDGIYSTEELAPLAEENLSKLSEWGYYTVLKADGVRVALGPAEAPQMAVEEGRLVLMFFLPIPTPLDPRAVTVIFSTFDPTFYIRMLPGENAPVLLGPGATVGCVASVEPRSTEETPYIADALIATMTIDPAEPENGPGASFASWIRLHCPAGP